MIIHFERKEESFFCCEPRGRESSEDKVELIFELELELIQTQMAQKPMLRAEVYAHAMRASQNRKKEVRVVWSSLV